MLRDSINNAIQYLLEGHEVQVSLDLIRDGLSASVLYSMDVEEFLRDIAFDYEEYHEQVIDIMNTYGIEVPFGIKSKHFVSGIKKRLENLLFFIESDDAYDIHTTIKYIFAMAVDVQIYLTANEVITYGTREPRLIYTVTVYNHADGELSETYTTYELSIALGLFKTEFFAALDKYYSLKDE